MAWLERKAAENDETKASWVRHCIQLDQRRRRGELMPTYAKSKQVKPVTRRSS
jgi:hypothetical protein